MRPKPKTKAARKRPRKADHACFYGYTSDTAWKRKNRVCTADQGVPEPAPYWDYGPREEQQPSEGGPSQ